MHAQKRLEALCERLQSRGYRLTKARRTILRALIEMNGHGSADDLAAQLKAQSTSVGRMTVYRTLELLSELGLARAVYLGSGAAHHVLIDNGHHHHLVCSNCDRVIEFEQCVVDEIEQLVGQHFEFEISGHLLEVYGRCAQCR